MAEKVISKAAQIRCSGNLTEIDVLSLAIWNEIDIHSKVTDATLVLTVESGVSSGGFSVEAQSGGNDFEIIDFICPATASDAVHLNITEEVNCIIKNPDEKVVLRIVGGVIFKANTELKIEYIPERVMYGGNEYYDVSVGRGGSGKVNLATGGLNFVHEDSAASGISHVYNSWQASKTGVDFDYPDVSPADREAIEKYSDYGCGKGWKLNVHQYLIKRRGTASQDLYSYVDGNGNYHEFSEKYYYENGNVKIYLDKDAVTIGFDGKLTHDGTEVKTELKSTSGLTLQTDHKGFAGAEKLELRSEDRVGIEENIENLKRTISDCGFALDEYIKAEKDEYKALINLREQIEDESASLERNSLLGTQDNKAQMEYILNVKKALDSLLKKNTDGKYANVPGSDYDAVLANYEANQDNYQSKLAAHQDVSREIAYSNANAVSNTDSNIGSTKDQMNRQNYATDALNFAQSELNSAQKKLNSAQKTLNAQVDWLQQVIRESSNKIEIDNWENNEVINADKSKLLDKQDQLRNDNRAYNKAEEVRQTARNQELCNRTAVDLIKARHLLEHKEFELKRLEDLEPVRFINGDGLIMGFNQAGVLIVIADAYENVTHINYDESGRITSITDSDNKETAFEYEDGLLLKIIDVDEKVTSFEYHSNGMLSNITYPDGANSSFGYIWGWGLLQTAVNHSGYGVRFSYDKNKIQKIEETTRTYAITDDGWRGFNSDDEEKEYAPRLLISITYNNHLCSTQVDRAGNKKTYIFDMLGKPATVYEGDYSDCGENTKSLSVDYSGAQQTFSISDNILYDNLLKDIDGVQFSGELPGDFRKVSQHVYEIDISTLPKDAANFVFSAWAKADSAFIESERKTGYSHSKMNVQQSESDKYKKNRKFALRAELEYINEKNEPEYEEFSASFDWLNTDWQYLALPIAVRQDDKIGDRIVSRFPLKLGGEDRTLIKLRVIIDYSHNVNGRYDGLSFDCATLREGDWTYNKINLDGTINYTEESTGSTTFYDYDKRGNAIKSTTKDKQYRSFVNTYEYNKQGALIRSTDFNGLCEETVYDDKGRELRSITYNIADPTSKLYSESIRDEKGKVIADVDITGEFNCAEYGFDHKGGVTVITDAEGGKTAFGYHNDDLVSVSGTVDGEENINTMKHTLGYTTKVSSGGTDYTFVYDGWGRQKETCIAGEKYLTNEYIDDYTVGVNLGNGESAVSITDKRGKIVEEKYLINGEEQEKTQNIYDDETNLLKQSVTVDKNGKTLYNVSYKYDKNGRLTYMLEDGIGSLEQELEYDSRGSVNYSRYEINGVSQSYYYEYEHAIDERQVKTILPGGAEQSLEYDGLGRIAAISLDDNFTKDIYYAKYGDHATKYVNSVWYGVNGKRNENVRYSYDKNGNITKVRENGKESVRYAYDSLGRIVREDNAVYKETIDGQVVAGKTETFEYDNNGNILAKTKYKYTTGDALSGGARTEYGYEQIGWKDKLLSYNGEAIGEYDVLGNPNIYRNKRLKWARGGSLIECGNERYTYNTAGKRTSKTVGNIETTYYLDGSKIIAEERRNNGNLTGALYYHYGTEGIAGFEYRPAGERGVTYVYRKKTQGLGIPGDITHIYDLTGKLCARYNYDAWGNHTVTCYDANGDVITDTAARATHVGNLNPFRYKSYYFDLETNFYYLGSRYYDPEVGRFINADDVSVLDFTKEYPNGLNLFAYCFNNPVNASDDCGDMPNWLKWMLGIVIIVAAVALSVVSVGVLTPLLAPLGAAVGGGLLGAVVVGAVAGAVGGAIAGFGVSIGMQGISNGFDNINWSQVGKDTLVGAISGFVAGGVFGGIKHVASAAKIANSVSGLSTAQANMDKAALVLKNTPIYTPGAGYAPINLARNAYDIANASLMLAQRTNTIVNFAVTQGYRLGQFGLKQLIGYGIKGWF